MHESEDMPNYLKVSVQRAISSRVPSHNPSRRINVPNRPLDSIVNLTTFRDETKRKPSGKKRFSHRMMAKSMDFEQSEATHVNFLNNRKCSNDINNTSMLKSLQNFNINKSTNLKKYTIESHKKIKVNNLINNGEQQYDIIEIKPNTKTDFNYK